MEKELFLASKSTKAAVIQNDDLIFNGKDILIPSYYASLVLDYVSKAPVETWNEADQEDFKQFKQFFNDVVTFKEEKVKYAKK
jgi:hypothetical protein